MYQIINSSCELTVSSTLQQIHFGFLASYPVAGMGEPWFDKLSQTHIDLKSRGISAILTLTEDNLYGDHHIKAGFRLMHEPMDDGEPPLKESLERAVAFINLIISTGQGVAVHCLEGRGRTGTVLGAWLAAKEKLRGEEAIARLRSLRSVTALSHTQKSFLLDYLGKSVINSQKDYVSE